MKRLLLALCLPALLIACQKEKTDDNGSLDYEEIDVCFTATLPGAEFPEGAEIGIVATCVRDGVEGTSMSVSQIARFKTGGTYLVPASDNDKVVARDNDHDFRFVAVYPYPEGEVDLKAIAVSVPETQNGLTDISTRLTSFGETKVLTVLPPVELTLSTPFSIITFEVPSEIFKGSTKIIKKMAISSETCDITQSGTYNALTGEFTQTGTGKAITVDFGEGLDLASSSAKVQFLTAPFTVPEEGLKVSITEGDNTVTNVDALVSLKEIGTEIKAGESFSTSLNGDGITPVKFPVEFPIGFADPSNNTTGYYNPTMEYSYFSEWTGDPAYGKANASADWVGKHGTFYCKTQPQAYITWNWADAIKETKVSHYLYYVDNFNTGNKNSSLSGILCSTPWPVGVWTGDYYEIVLPVRNFKAGSTLKLDMAIYTRKGPVFYEVLYLDGEEWKSTATDNLPAYEGAEVKARATFAVPFAQVYDVIDNSISVRMPFVNGVESGEIKIRIKCVDGTIIASAANAVATVSAPNASSGLANAPLYFLNLKDRSTQSIKIELL